MSDRSDAPELDPRVAAIDSLLPQTQCTRCGYEGCLPYARAIAKGEADINQCPPGGQPTIDALAALLARPAHRLNPANGVEQPPRRAVIDETRCIGCAKCLPACPVDAIVGAHRLMHTVIGPECNGCELCLPPCPVDCISLVPVTQDGRLQPLASWEDIRRDAPRFRARFEQHTRRRERERAGREQLLAARKQRAAAWQTREPKP